MKILDTGLDWPETPSLYESHPYGPCLVAVSDKGRFDKTWTVLAQNVGILRSGEIKGYESPPRVLACVLELVMANDAFVGVWLLDKGDAISRKAVWPSPSALH